MFDYQTGVLMNFANTSMYTEIHIFTGSKMHGWLHHLLKIQPSQANFLSPWRLTQPTST